MATVNKDFKIKSGLIVEGTNATVNGYDILTKANDQYIIDIVGGTTLITSVDANQLQVIDGELSVQAEVFDDFGAAATAESNAISAAATDATTKANAAQAAAEATAAGDATTKANNAYDNALADANTYTDGEISTEVSNRNSAISSAISTEVTNRNSAIATAKSEAGTIAQGYADTAESNANSYTDTSISNLNLSGTYDALGAADAALVDAKAYTDQEVAALVDGAPALLDTLNELAAAIADNPNYATDVANLVGTKQDALTASTGITIDGSNNISVTANTYDAYGSASSAQSAAESYADSLASNYDAAGSAATAQGNAEDYADTVASAAQTAAEGYADSLAPNYDAAGSAASAEAAAKSYADGLASNYDAAGSAATAEANANDYTDTSISNLNLSGTYDALGAAATAESNANSYTDTAIANGDSNATPTYQAINVGWMTKEIGAYTSVATASTANVFEWTNYPTAKFIVRVRAGVNSQVSEVLLTSDNSGNIAITEYAIVSTNGNLGDISASYSAGTWSLNVTTTENNSEVIVAGTLMTYGD